MKHKNLYNAVSKHAVVNEIIHTERCMLYSANNGHNTIEWYVQHWKKSDGSVEESVTSPYVKSNRLQDDMQSDYFSGSFEHTIKSAVSNFLKK